ncbi:hypothetical protein [Halobaculum sp. MBLA0143]|uniref:hypothetical protein n=1 Tax=Halobaculum sp. MBLA0143 TaxID=3079933 RepID=UPI0035267FFF
MTGDGDGFTTQEMDRFRQVIRERAARDLAATEELSAEGIPSWLSKLPTALPLEFCAQVPFADNVCMKAPSPVSITSYQCGGLTYSGLRTRMAVGWGPGVEIENGTIGGTVRYKAALNLIIDPSKPCPLALKLESGTGEEVCISPQNCTISPKETVVALANDLYDTVYDAVKDGFQQIGYVPPEQVLIAITALACIAYAVLIGASVLPGPASE